MKPKPFKPGRDSNISKLNISPWKKRDQERKEAWEIRNKKAVLKKEIKKGADRNFISTIIAWKPKN